MQDVFLNTQAYWGYRFLNKKMAINITEILQIIGRLKQHPVVSYRFSREQAYATMVCFLMLSKGILLSFFCVYTRSCKQLSALLLHKYDVYQNKIRGESQWEIILIGNYP